MNDLLAKLDLTAVILGLSGYKTYIAAAGLLGLALYQASVGEFAEAGQSLLGAGAAIGLRSAVAKAAATPPAP